MKKIWYNAKFEYLRVMKHIIMYYYQKINQFKKNVIKNCNRAKYVCNYEPYNTIILYCNIFYALVSKRLCFIKLLKCGST